MLLFMCKEKVELKLYLVNSSKIFYIYMFSNIEYALNLFLIISDNKPIPHNKINWYTSIKAHDIDPVYNFPRTGAITGIAIK